MDDKKLTKTPKEIVTELRTNFRQSKKLLSEIEKAHQKNQELISGLADKENGAKVNLEWVAKQKKDIAAAGKKLTSLTNALDRTVQTSEKKIIQLAKAELKYQSAKDRAFDKNTGMDAVLKETKRFRALVKSQHTQAGKLFRDIDNNKVKADDALKQINKSFQQFEDIKKKFEDKKDGLEAQIAKTKQYAKDALTAKSDAEGSYLSVKSLEEKVSKLADSSETANTNIKTLESESETLTENIKNTLNLASANSLSESLAKANDELDKRVKAWTWAQIASIVLLGAAVVAIFILLFLTGNENEVARKLAEGPTWVGVVSKALFTSPFAFLVYFTTKNFSHAREQRDRYFWKTTVAKNFQNYVSLLNKEFEQKYADEIFEFGLETVRGIYTDPTVTQLKKRRYNFAFKNVFQVGLEEEDIRHAIEKTFKNYATDKVPKNGTTGEVHETNTPNHSEALSINQITVEPAKPIDAPATVDDSIESAEENS